MRMERKKGAMRFVSVLFFLCDYLFYRVVEFVDFLFL